MRFCSPLLPQAFCRFTHGGCRTQSLLSETPLNAEIISLWYYHIILYDIMRSPTLFLRPSSIINLALILPFTLFLKRNPYIFMASWVTVLYDSISEVPYSTCSSMSGLTTKFVIIGILCAGVTSFLGILKLIAYSILNQDRNSNPFPLFLP